jgi:hypothetical protein
MNKKEEKGGMRERERERRERERDSFGVKIKLVSNKKKRNRWQGVFLDFRNPKCDILE